LANGYSVKHVPIDYVPRELGKSKFRWWSDTKQYLTQVVRMMLSYEPLRVFLPIGLTLIFLGLGKMGYDWMTKEFRLTTNTLLLFFAAFQMISIGFLADLMVRLNKPKEEVAPASLTGLGKATTQTEESLSASST
jgi:polyisoprenyl-phosphate glycosyltransferase